jgi:hypothetical protein
MYHKVKCTLKFDLDKYKKKREKIGRFHISYLYSGGTETVSMGPQLGVQTVVSVKS